MFSSPTTKEVLVGFRSFYHRAANDDSSVPLAFPILAVCWLFWRLWTFTILPALRPTEPKEVPYWIPCELSMIRDSASAEIRDLEI